LLHALPRSCISTSSSEHCLPTRGGGCQPVLLLLRLGLLLLLDLSDDGFDLFKRKVLRTVSRQLRVTQKARERRRDETYANFAESLHDGEIDVLGSGLNHLEQTLDRELDRLVLRHLGGPVLLQELAHGFGRATDSIGLRTEEGELNEDGLRDRENLPSRR
jgi:hypothetical protein